MKLVTVVAILAVLAGCLAPLTYQLKAQVRIVSTEVSPSGNLLQIQYELKNEGNVTIDYYEVYFLVTFTDGTSTIEWANGLSIPVAQTRLDSALVYIGGKAVAEVKVYAINLKNIAYNLSVTLKP